MKVLFLSTVGFHINGIASVIASFCDGLNKLDKNIQIDIASHNQIAPKFLEVFKSAGVNVHQIPSRKHFFKYYSALKKLLSQQNYDIVHINGNSFSMIFECLAAKRANKHTKIVVHGHATSCKYMGLHKMLKGRLSKMADICVACSKDSGEFAFNRGFTVIPNGMDTNAYVFNAEHRDEIRKKYGLQNKVVILQVGLLKEIKNHQFTIECAKKLPDNFHFIFVGDGILRQQLETLVKQNNLQNITFMGTQTDVEPYYSAADFFVLPSLHEAFGLVLVEAQINGLSCIAHDQLTRYSCVEQNKVKYLPLDSDLWVAEISKQQIREGNKPDMQLYTKFDCINSSAELLKIYNKAISKAGRHE